MQTQKLPERVLLDFSALGFRDVVMIGRYRYNRAHPPLKPHLHEQVFEICVLEQGTQTYFVGSRRYDLAGGDILFTKPGEVHSTGREPEHKGRLFWVELRADLPRRSLLGLSLKESRLLLGRLRRLPFRHIHHGEILIPAMERIFEVFADGHNPMRIADLRNLLLRFILDFVTLAEHKAARHLDAGISRALDCIGKNLASAVSIATLASEARLSESFFKKKFKVQVGMPPFQFATHQRIDQAKKLLCRNDMTVTQIAMDLGFATSQHFATSFKRLTGMTPREFRCAANIRDQPSLPEIGSGIDFHPIGPKERGRY